MIFYISGCCNRTTLGFVAQRFPEAHLLLSYAHVSKSDYLLDIAKKYNEKDKLLFDSGAYSVICGTFDGTKESYCQFVKEHGIKNYVHFDVHESKENLFNLKWMEDQGLHPLPVTHGTENAEGEDVEYIIQNYSHFCMGGIVTMIGSKKFVGYVDRLFKKAYDLGKKPRIHGFGVGSGYLILRYPWYSIDNSKWRKDAAYGRLTLIEGPKTTQLCIADNSPFRRTERHLWNIPKELRDKIVGLIEAEGFKLEEVAGDTDIRSLFNLTQYMKAAEAAVGKATWDSFERKGFFE